MFTAFDQKFTGKFSIYDLKDTIRAIGEDIGEEEIEKIFRAADSDGDGYVTSEDFYAIVTKKEFIWLFDTAFYSIQCKNWYFFKCEDDVFTKKVNIIICITKIGS